MLMHSIHNSNIAPGQGEANCIFYLIFLLSGHNLFAHDISLDYLINCIKEA